MKKISGLIVSLATPFNVPDYVVCVDNGDYPASLELHKIYRTLPDDEAARSGDLRVIDESGEDYLFPVNSFVAINPPDQVRSALLRATGS